MSEENDQLNTIACPNCATVGSIRLGEKLVARPLGTWSLAGQQLKTSVMWTTALICTVNGCGFYKLPKAGA